MKSLKNNRNVALELALRFDQNDKPPVIARGKAPKQSHFSITRLFASFRMTEDIRARFIKTLLYYFKVGSHNKNGHWRTHYMVGA